MKELRLELITVSPIPLVLALPVIVLERHSIIANVLSIHFQILGPLQAAPCVWAEVRPAFPSVAHIYLTAPLPPESSPEACAIICSSSFQVSGVKSPNTG